jgi:hypothetical protein
MPEQESEFEYRNTCHFYNMKSMTPGNKRLKEIYCIEWPEKCAIYQQNAAGKSVPTTPLPTDTLEEICEP